MNWLREHQSPLKIETPYQRFPLEVQLMPLSRNHYYSLKSENDQSHKNEKSTQEDCLEPEDIKRIKKGTNCTNFCLPFIYQAFFNKSTQMKNCENVDDYFCAMGDIHDYLQDQQLACMKPMVEKNFIGSARFYHEFSNYFPDIITEETKRRTLMQLFWAYQSKDTIISEEKLVYDSKDLVAWLGGALGIFLGYSFFDLSKNIIDLAFYFIYKIVNR